MYTYLSALFPRPPRRRAQHYLYCYSPICRHRGCAGKRGKCPRGPPAGCALPSWAGDDAGCECQAAVYPHQWPPWPTTHQWCVARRCPEAFASPAEGEEPCCRPSEVTAPPGLGVLRDLGRRMQVSGQHCMRARGRVQGGAAPCPSSPMWGMEAPTRNSGALGVSRQVDSRSPSCVWAPELTQV